MAESQQLSLNPRPRQLNFALRTMWVTFALSATYIIILFIQVSAADPEFRVMLVPMGIIYTLLLLGLAILIYKSGRGRNWARITYAVIASIAIAVLVLGIFGSFAQARIDWVSLAASLTIVGIYAFVLSKLFHRESNEWFRSLRVRKEA